MIKKLLMVALAGLLAQQSFAYMSSLVVAVSAPAITQNLGFDPALVGAYAGIMFAASTLSSLSSGPFIERFGPLRMAQTSLLLMGAGLLAATPGLLASFALSGVLIGSGTALSVPAGSHIIARHAPPRHAPLIFSIKQTGVPVGGILAGVIVPMLTLSYGWQGGFVGASVLCISLAVLLQPLRARLDDRRQPGTRLSLGAVVAGVGEVMRRPALRHLALASFAFVCAQIVFASFFVLNLVDGLGYDLAAAGGIFAAAQFTAIPARIFWGWIAGNWVSPRQVLAGLGMAIAASAVAMGMIDRSWPLWAITVLAMVYSASALSWHGVFLAQVARQLPAERVARVTGSVMAFTGMGQMIAPALFGAILATTGSYGYGFILAAAPAFAMGVVFLRPTPPDRAPPAA